MKRKLIFLLAGATLVFLAGVQLRRSAFPAAPESGGIASPIGRNEADKQSEKGPEFEAEKSGPIPHRIPLLKAETSQKAVWKRKTPAALRAQFVEPSAALMSHPPLLKEGDRIALPLFEDTQLAARISDISVYSIGTVGITAQLEEGRRGVVYMAYSENKLRVSADVFGGSDYYVRFDPAAGRHIAIEVDRAASDYLGCAVCAQHMDDPVEERPVSERLTASAAGFFSETDEKEDEETVVDIMFVYTPAAKKKERGFNGIRQTVSIAMQKANETMGNSDTKVRFNLIHAAEVDYEESGDARTDLDYLTFTGGTNSAMDEVHAWRDTYKADLVCLLADLSDAGGIAWALDTDTGRVDRAFSLSRIQQTDSAYTLVHEWGHNMGCHHSKTQPISQGPLLYDYSAGWQWRDTGASIHRGKDGFCTVMTYGYFSETERYEEVPYFSNPSIDYIGAETNAAGHPLDGDNARTIRNIRKIIAAYRESNSTRGIAAFPSTNSFERFVVPHWEYRGEIFWQPRQGTTPSPFTGPLEAYRGTNYVYLEATLRNRLKTALLDAKFDFTALNTPELEFAYHMYGKNMGALHTEVSIDGGASWTILWALSGNQGNGWKTASVNLGDYGGMADVRVRFRGITSNRNTSDMALDEVIVRQGIQSIDAVDFPLTNSFERPVSYWGYSGEIFWQPHQGATPSSSTGPSEAHEGVNYAYLEMGFKAFLKTALLDAKFDFTALSAPELEFAYHMYGEDMGTLHTEVSIDRGASWTALWALSGDQGNEWKTNSVDLSAYGGMADVRVRFRGVAGDGRKGDMALDELIVRQNSRDSDGDGMPNEWEEAYFSTPTRAAPNEDNDRDGAANLAEYISGHDPTNPDSVFRITDSGVIFSAENTPFYIAWDAVSGRVYTVKWSDDLLSSPFINNDLSGALPYPVNCFTDTVDRAGRANFYRIDVRLAE